VPLESAPMEIRVDDLRGAAIIDLLQLHLRSVALHSPPESIHALDLAALRKPDITFWSVWQHDDLLGCGALKALDVHHGEIKSMRTVPRHLRKGVAAALLGGWLGGELVERLGVGVTPNANLNAPNSLTHSAKETKKRMTDAESY